MLRLFPKVDGTVDRFDRAALLSPPFSIAWGEGEEPPPEPSTPAVGMFWVISVVGDHHYAFRLLS